MRVALKRVDPDPDPEADADAEDDEEFFDPSDFDDEDSAAQRSERAAETFSAFCLEAAAAMRAATSSALIPSIALIPPLAALFVDCALHNQDAIYLLEGDNVGR